MNRPTSAEREAALDTEEEITGVVQNLQEHINRRFEKREGNDYVSVVITGKRVSMPEVLYIPVWGEVTLYRCWVSPESSIQAVEVIGAPEGATIPNKLTLDACYIKKWKTTPDSGVRFNGIYVGDGDEEWFCVPTLTTGQR